MKSSRDLIASAKQEIPEASVSKVKQKIDGGHDFVLLDIRDNDEYRAGYIPSAVYISRGMLELEIEDYVPDRNQEIVLYCAGGVRSLLAAQTLKSLGYTRLISMSGGFRDWLSSGNAVDKPVAMTTEQMERYSRHFMLRAVSYTHLRAHET